MSDTLKEYIVTLHNFENLDAFYNDMETPGGDLYIPNRSVDVKHRRNISRNTHYMLNDAEAETLRNDSRVLAVEQPPSALGIQKIAHWEQTSNFEKDNSILGNFNNTDKNWGLLRVTEGSNLANWGTNGSFTQTNQTVKTTSSGKNVDVVMVDSHIKTDHPEFAVNSDGSGGSRVQQFNWFSLNSQLGINAGSSNYDYSDISSNHGTHKQAQWQAILKVGQEMPTFIIWNLITQEHSLQVIGNFTFMITLESGTKQKQLIL